MAGDNPDDAASRDPAPWLGDRGGHVVEARDGVLRNGERGHRCTTSLARGQDRIGGHTGARGRCRLQVRDARVWPGQRSRQSHADRVLRPRRRREAGDPVQPDHVAGMTNRLDVGGPATGVGELRGPGVWVGVYGGRSTADEGCQGSGHRGWGDQTVGVPAFNVHRGPLPRRDMHFTARWHRTRLGVGLSRKPCPTTSGTAAGRALPGGPSDLRHTASAAESESADPSGGRGWDQGSPTVRLDRPECHDSAVGKTAHAMRSERPLPCCHQHGDCRARIATCSDQGALRWSRHDSGALSGSQLPTLRVGGPG